MVLGFVFAFAVVWGAAEVMARLRRGNVEAGVVMTMALLGGYAFGDAFQKALISAVTV